MTDHCSGAASPPRKVSIDESVRTVQAALDGADAARAAQLAGLQAVRLAKATSLEREHERLATALGADDPRVSALAQKIALNRNVTMQLQRAADRAGGRAPQAVSNTWIVHGHVRTRDLKPVSQVTVALYACEGEWVRAYGHDCTDEQGHFRLCAKVGEMKTADTVAQVTEAPSVQDGQPIVTREGAPAEAQANPTGNLPNPRGFLLRVTDAKQMLLGVDSVPLVPRAGHVDYREIILDGKVCAPPPGGGREPGTGKDPEAKTRYLGNSQNRELHDLENTKKNCRIGQIAPDHRVPFATIEDALKARYDYCAYCFGKAKSKR